LAFIIGTGSKKPAPITSFYELKGKEILMDILEITGRFGLLAGIEIQKPEDAVPH
jgi:hypothetical protein